MARDNNKARRSVATSLIVRQQMVLLDTLDNIEHYGFDLKAGTGDIAGLEKEDREFKEQTLSVFNKRNGLFVAVGGSPPFQQLGKHAYHISYHGNLDRLRRRHD